MGCRPEDAAESDMARASENGLGTRNMPHLGAAGESRAQVRGQATRLTTLGMRRSAPPRRGRG